MEFAFKHVADPRRRLRDAAARLPAGAPRGDRPLSSRRRSPEPEELAWVLAHHWREAGELDAARGYLLAAAERARAVARGGGDVRPVHARARAGDDGRGAPPDPPATRPRARGARGLRARRPRSSPTLIPELSGADEIEALLARGRATHVDRAGRRDAGDGRARAGARALATARRSWRGPRSRPAPAGYAMRGEEGDLDRANELGDRALELWSRRRATDRARRAVPHARQRPLLDGVVRARARALRASGGDRRSRPTQRRVPAARSGHARAGPRGDGSLRGGDRRRRPVDRDGAPARSQGQRGHELLDQRPP